jgi:hypothetical protein
MAGINKRPLIRYVIAIEGLLADPPAPGTLARLVAWDGNRVLDDLSDEGAAKWLRDMVEFIRGLLGASEPPRASAPLRQ